MKDAYSLRFSRSAETYERWALPQKESASKLVKFVNPEGFVLDLGCGTGFVSACLPKGCTAFGVDIAQGMLKFYKRKFRRAVLGDAECLPFRDRSFDFVLSNFSLHWTTLEKSIQEAKRVARVGVGIAMPVQGSLHKLGFPFPEEGKVIEFFEGWEVRSVIEEMEIPFRGMELVRFFHHTGSSLNPLRRRVLGKKELTNLINSIEKPLFRMLFLYARVV